MISFLVKALVWPYYRSHAGFFFLLLYFAFGLLRTSDHLALAEIAAEQTGVIVVLLLVWTLYLLESYYYLKNLIEKAVYRFLFPIILLPKRKISLLFTLVFSLINAPVIVYSLFIGWFAILHQSWLNLVILLLFAIIAASIPALGLIKHLRSPYTEPKSNGFLLKFRRTKPGANWLWVLQHLFQNKLLLFSGTKLLSLGVIQFTWYVYVSDVYDWRLPALGTLFSFGFHTVLMYSVYQFKEHNLALFRSYPISQANRFLDQHRLSALLLLPEFILLIRNYSGEINLFHLSGMLIFGLELATFYVAVLISQNQPEPDIEKLGKYCFVMFIGIFIAILFGMNLLGISTILLLFNLHIFQRYYTFASGSK